MPGGWLGVETFFVLSGFVITAIILQAADRQPFVAKKFYANRIARLFPASALWSLPCLP